MKYLRLIDYWIVSLLSKCDGSVAVRVASSLTVIPKNWDFGDLASTRGAMSSLAERSES
jgi:hypothetical protein